MTRFIDCLLIRMSQAYSRRTANTTPKAGRWRLGLDRAGCAGFGSTVGPTPCLPRAAWGGLLPSLASVGRRVVDGGRGSAAR